MYETRERGRGGFRVGKDSDDPEEGAWQWRDLGQYGEKDPLATTGGVPERWKIEPSG